METRYAKRKKGLHHKPDNASAQDDQNGADRISDLPREIVHRIFSFLPLEHVAKTSVLSKRWKYLWYSYPCLDFSNAFESIFWRERKISGSDSASQKLRDHIDVVLSSLDKHSDISVLKFYGQVDISAVVRSMQLAVEHNVRELDLEFFTEDCFDLPLCIINSSSLRDLTLKSWGVCYRVPPLDPATNFFRSLRTLNLSDADFRNQSSVLNLFTDSLFPCLENLRLESCSGLEHLRIHMSGLKYLCLEIFRILELDISAEKLERLIVTDSLANNPASSRVAIDAPLLESISWMNYVTGEFVIGRCDSLKEATLQFRLSRFGFSDSQLRSFSSFLDGISQCQSLTLDVSVFEILSASNHLPGVQPHVLDRLTSLEVKLSDENCAKWNADFSKMIGYKEDDIDWESEARSLDILFLHRLKVVRISGFKACSNDVGLVKLLLNHAKVLEQLLLEYEDDSASGEKAESEIRELPRASPNVRIIFVS